jgi:hypothetical protein
MAGWHHAAQKQVIDQDWSESDKCDARKQSLARIGLYCSTKHHNPPIKILAMPQYERHRRKNDRAPYAMVFPMFFDAGARESLQPFHVYTALAISLYFVGDFSL